MFVFDIVNDNIMKYIRIIRFIYTSIKLFIKRTFQALTEYIPLTLHDDIGPTGQRLSGEQTEPDRRR